MEQPSWKTEYWAFAVILGLSIIIGLYYGCVKGKQDTIKEYLLGGKHMSVFSIALSLIASHISSVTMMGLPVEVYTYGTQYLIVVVVNVVVIVITLYVFLPVFYELQLTSVYKYLELRFNSNIRSLCSLIFTLHLILFIPVVIYTQALAFNQVTGINVQVLTVVICVICIFSTTIGGLKGVVFSDAVHSLYTFISIAIVIVMGCVQAGGIGNVIKANREGDRIEFFNMDPNPFLRNSFWTVSVGMTFGWLSSLSIHPGTVQRFMALPTYGKAKAALIYFLIGIAMVIVMTGGIGMLMYTKYQSCDPFSANYIANNKNLVPFYVMDVAGTFPGVNSLLITGLINTALSTMSAQLNTISGTIYEDFVVKIINAEISDWTASVIMKCTVVIFGAICVALVLVVEKFKNILQISLSLIGVTSGAMLSVFTLGLCFPRANSRGAMFGMLVSVAVMTWIVTGAQVAIYNEKMIFTEKTMLTSGCPVNITLKNHTEHPGLYRLNKDVYISPDVWTIYTVSYIHYNTIGTLVGIAVGLIVSVLFPDIQQPVDPKLLAPFVRPSNRHRRRPSPTPSVMATTL